MNIKTVRRILGLVLFVEAVSMLLPIVCAIIYGEKDCIFAFSKCIVLAIVIGGLLTIKTNSKESMFAKEGFASVALAWIVMSIFGALPFVFSGTIPNFIDALFETASGFSTTGASILTDVEALPKSMLFWRSFTHWLGGMGVLVFLLAIIPSAGGNNFFLMKAESPGPSVSKLVPRVKTSATILYGIYIVMTVIEMIILLLGGMEAFDAITLSLGTAGTGGFAVRNSGLSDYSAFSQIVITVFMILFGIDFSLYYLTLTKKVKSALKSSELHWYLIIIFTAITAITINCRHLFASLGETIRHTAFQVGSIITTTGYSTCDFNLWPELSKTILVTLMFVGACAGSTGGGIKVSRIIILAKSLVKEIRIAAHPKATVKTTMNGRLVEHETVRSINTYMVAYVIIFVVSILLISFDNFDYTTNFTAVSATLNNIGPGLNLVGPTGNFSMFSPVSKLVMVFDMLAGRLEIFPMLVLFSKFAWKK